MKKYISSTRKNTSALPAPANILTISTEETIYYTQSIYKTKGAWLFNTSSHYPAIPSSIYL
jgi:hypothetical protein